MSTKQGMGAGERENRLFKTWPFLSAGASREKAQADGGREGALKQTRILLIKQM